jgi:DNA-binding response OmpR family regulator
LEETRHSLERISRAKQKKLSKALKDICLNETGGLAGLFHLCLFRQNQTNEIINTVQRELTLCPELSVHLTTLEFRQFLASKFSQTFSYKHINLNRLPTAQEINLLNLFLEKENRPTTRDEVAETIWGKKWQEKYSDWAIDKAISRLRENLNSEIHKLITIKSLGYTLICNQN